MASVALVAQPALAQDRSTAEELEELIPDSALDELPFERSVGGLDDAGEPLDYYTRLPDRQFDIDRSTGVDSNTNRSGAYRLEDTGLSPRQAVPDRYRGRWD